MDIVISTIALIDELTDEDLMADTNVEGERGIRILVDNMVIPDQVKHKVENEAFKLLVHNLTLLNEDDIDDKEGIFNILSIAVVL